MPAPSAAPTTSAARRSSSRKVLYVPRPMTGPSCRCSITATGHQPSRARVPTGRERGGEEPRIVVRVTAHVGQGQVRAHLAPARRPRPRPRHRAWRRARGPTGHAISRSPRMSLSAERVWCETPPWRSRGSRPEYRTTTMARPPRAAAAFAASETARPPCPSAEPLPTMPGPMPQTTTSKPFAFAHASAEAGDSAWTSPSKHGRDGDGRLEQLPRLQQAHRVGQRDRQRASRELHVRDPHAGADPGDDRRELAVQPAADDRQPVELLRQRIVLLDARDGGLPGRVGKRHHVRRPGPAAVRAHASGSRRRCRSRRSRAPRSRPCVLTRTVSPTSTGPVCRG